MTVRNKLIREATLTRNTIEVASSGSNGWVATLFENGGSSGASVVTLASCRQSLSWIAGWKPALQIATIFFEQFRRPIYAFLPIRANLFLMDAYFDKLIEYVLEELSEDRRLLIRAHLDSGCIECNAEVRQLKETFHMLPGALPAYTLNPELKTYVQDAIQAENLREQGLQSGRLQSHVLNGAGDLQVLRETETSDRQKPMEQSIPNIRIAVLYFENLSEEKESDYFRAGMTEDIITELSKVRAWEVRPRTQVVQFKDQTTDIRNIGRELGVTHVLHGSIRKSGNRLRISAHLVDATSSSSVWSERYDRDLSDVFEIQAEIAQKIAAALRVHLTHAEQKQIQRRQTDSLQAYDEYLRGRESMFLLTRDGIDTAITYFENAIKIDPKYAMSYAGLAQACALRLSFFGGPEELADRAIENAKRALKLNPDQAQAEAALGLSYLLKRMSSEATDACKRAIELNPLDAFAQWISGRLFYRLNQYEHAIERFQKTVELVPDFYTAYSDLAQAYENLGRQEEAQEMRRRTIEACKSYLKTDPNEARAHIFMATANAWLGNKESALNAGSKAEELNPDDPVMMYNLACLYSLLDEGNRAVEWLKKSVQHGRRDFEWMKRDPALANIRNHPGYLRLIQS